MKMHGNSCEKHWKAKIGKTDLECVGEKDYGYESTNFFF